MMLKSLIEILMLIFCCDLVEIFKLRLSHGFEAEVWWRFSRESLIDILMLKFGQDSDAEL